MIATNIITQPRYSRISRLSPRISQPASTANTDSRHIRSEATAGFVCYSRKALETLDLDAVKMKGYGFQIEMKYSAWRLGLKVGEVSIIFTERQEGASKMSGGIFGEAFFGVLKLPFRRISARK